VSDHVERRVVEWKGERRIVGPRTGRNYESVYLYREVPTDDLMTNVVVVPANALNAIYEVSDESVVWGEGDGFRGLDCG
jgi:hypothetical protein